MIAFESIRIRRNSHRTLFLSLLTFTVAIDYFSLHIQYPVKNHTSSATTSQTFPIRFVTLSQFDLPKSVISPSSAPSVTSIITLVAHPEAFHQQLIRIRGIIKQPELHLDDTQLQIHFVFQLTEENHFLTVFGIHDRTQGGPSIAMDQQVEVVGIFYKERTLNTFPLTNLVEAITIGPYPPMEPEQT